MMLEESRTCGSVPLFRPAVDRSSAHPELERHGADPEQVLAPIKARVQSTK